MVKSGVPYVTLAVGDGANDVSMIRSAHVGVGVMGQEGMQAVRSADYAVQQFSHLGRLLLLHGRLSYMRTSQCINYFFYKNIVFTLPQFIYGVMSVHSGQVRCEASAHRFFFFSLSLSLSLSNRLHDVQTFFCDLYITAYNVLFTAMPVIVRAIMETDLPERIAETFPELYRSGAHNEYFSLGTLAKSSAVATFHAMVLTIIPMLLFQTGNLIGKQGPGGDIWMGSVASFFYIVPIVHFQIFYETWNWNKVVSTTYVASLTLFFIAIAVYDNFTSAIEGVWRTVVVTPVFWLGFALSTALCLIPWLAYQAYVCLCRLVCPVDLFVLTVMVCTSHTAMKKILSRPIRCTFCAACDSPTRSSMLVKSSVSVNQWARLVAVS
jgi:magnesium-transporting ATPase (P-type)